MFEKLLVNDSVIIITHFILSHTDYTRIFDISTLEV